MQPSDINVTHQDGKILARVGATNLEEQHAHLLLQELMAAADSAPAAPVLLNMSAVASMPSVAIGALMTLWKKFQDNHQRFILVGMQSPVRNTLALCRLDKFFEFSESEAEALKRLQP